MKFILKFILILLNLATGAALVFSAWSGWLDAAQHPRLVIASMSFPLWILPGLVLLIIDFFVVRKWCVWMALCFALCLPLAFTVMPVNAEGGSVPTKYAAPDSTWTLLTYNVSNYQDLTDEYADDLNPSLRYILEQNPDMVVLEEAHWLCKGLFHITAEQLDSIHTVYPWVIVGRDITLFSKFPAREISMKSFPEQFYGDSPRHSKAACFAVDINGVETAIYGLHLKSLGLTRDDKNLYEEFTRGEGLTSRTDIAEAKNDLIAKIADANVERAEQIEVLIDEIRKLDFANVIVCGDFNDTPGCYALRRLESIGLREVYPLVGCGYMYTFNSDRLLFQIDHVLFKGAMRPWKIERGNLRTSDHYPLMTTFIYPR